MPTTHHKDRAAVALGSRKSPRKAASSRANGLKGGGSGNPYLTHGKELAACLRALLEFEGASDEHTWRNLQAAELKARAVLAKIDGNKE